MKLALCLTLALSAWLLHPTEARPHEWYEPSCCSGRDCAPIPVDAVGFDADGNYLVTIEGGGHPFVRETTTYRVPRSKERPSRDGNWHLCVSPTGRHVYCLYAPGMF